MSVLEKLRNLSSANMEPDLKASQERSAQLFDCHPLADDEVLFRFQYLAAIALGTAIDRNPSEEERRAFFGLANSIGLDASDVEELLSERDCVSEADMAILFESVQQRPPEFDS